MANTYYDSQLTAEEIEAALEAIDGVIVPANNGKVLAINNGKIEARSVQWGGGGAVVQPLSVTQNGTYNPPSGVDGYAPVTVNVSGGGSDIDPNYSCLYSYYVTKSSGSLYPSASESYTVTTAGKYIAINYIVNGEASTKAIENSISTSGVVVAQDSVAHDYSNGNRNDSFVIKVVDCAVGDTIDFSASRPNDANRTTGCFAVITIPDFDVSGISRDVYDVKNDNTNRSGKTYDYISNSYHLNIALSCDSGNNLKWTSYVKETVQESAQTYNIGSVSRSIDGYSYDRYDKLEEIIISLNCIITDPSKTSIQVWHDGHASYMSHGFISYALTVQNS